MKKLLFMLLCFVYFLSFLKADGVESPVTFTLLDSFYSSIVKKYENGTTVFYYNNKLLNMDLTDSELDSILSQKSGGQRLTYYEALKIEVKPVEGTKFASLQGKTNVYRANGGGSWVTNITHGMDMYEYAESKNLTNYFWPWGFSIVYRTDTNDEFSSTIPSSNDLNNKTLEEQLATLLGYDLVSNPDSVKNAYKTYWKFKPLNDYTYIERFDFFSEKDGVSPVLKSGSSDEYDVNSLNHLGEYYVSIKYSMEEEKTTMATSYESDSTNWIVPTTLVLITIVGVSLFLLNKYKFKWF